MPAINSAPTVGLALPDSAVIARNRLLVSLLFLAAVFALQSAPAHAQEPITPPQTTPDAESGLQIFAQRCASCHGPLGMGDGEMAAQLPQPPAALGSETYLREAVPARMFDVITNGIPEAAMPPFGPGNSDPLNDAERWNLVAAIYGLGMRQSLITEGQAIYEENCMVCHGQNGAGEEDAADLREQTYWIERSDQDVFQLLAQDQIPAHEAYELGEEALRAVTGYARTFSYVYADAMAAFEPIATAEITGAVTNETTGQPLSAGIPAVLNAFTTDFEPSLTMTTTLDAAGQFEFELTMIPPDLVYVVTVQYDGISYGSDFGRLERNDPALNLEIPVFERSSDPSTVSIGQLHIILQFAEGQLQVNELYQFNQNASAVFVGQSGDPGEGTVHISLPPGAGEPSFDRSFGGMESFFPADTVMPTADGWADTVPLRPGQGTLSLLVRYTLPYDESLSFSHPLHYDVTTANLVMPDASVDLVSGSGWQEAGPQAMGEAGVFLNFTQADLAAGDALSVSLQGEPQQAGTTSAGIPPQRNQTNELLIGGGVLLLAIAVGGYVLRQWRQDQESEAEGVPRPQTAEERRQALLAAVAALDDAYEAGELQQPDYEERRQALKDELVAIWKL